jgi:protein CpxP
MPSIAHQPIPVMRSFAVVALLGATMLASPLNVARAADTAGVPASQAGATAPATKSETVEQRITTLHAQLKITPDEEANWNAVARTMRENAAAMDKLIAESRAKPPQNQTAVEDLQMYQKFSEAHVEGLKNLISSFSTLYTAMPDAQKKIADQVFRSAHQAGATRGQTG